MNTKKKNKKTIYLIIGILVIVIAGILSWSLKSHLSYGGVASSTPDTSVWGTGAPADATTALPNALNSTNAIEFTHKYRHFSFMYPSNMKLSDFLDDNNNEVILVQDADKGEGFQITISAFDEDKGSTTYNLTEDRIHQDLPDLTITNPQPVTLGSAGTGLAFNSDNDQFGGASREVWFVYDGYLYQISTYAHLDPLIKSVLATWKFQ